MVFDHKKDVWVCDYCCKEFYFTREYADHVKECDFEL